MSLFKLQVKTKNQTYPIIIGDGSANRLKTILKENSINFKLVKKIKIKKVWTKLPLFY